MSYIDVAIPGIVGLLLLLSPQMFLNKSTSPDQNKIRMLNKLGVMLLVVAALYHAITVFNK